jgi:hypothetical protein
MSRNIPLSSFLTKALIILEVATTLPIIKEQQNPYKVTGVT